MHSMCVLPSWVGFTAATVPTHSWSYQKKSFLSKPANKYLNAPKFLAWVAAAEFDSSKLCHLQSVLDKRAGELCSACLRKHRLTEAQDALVSLGAGFGIIQPLLFCQKLRKNEPMCVLCACGKLDTPAVQKITHLISYLPAQNGFEQFLTVGK